MKQEQYHSIFHFTLPGLFPGGQILAVNIRLGIVSLLAQQEDDVQLLKQEQFQHQPLCVLLELLRSYPVYCPTELLLAKSVNAHVSEHLIEICRQRLQEEEDDVRQELASLRVAISRARCVLKTFGITIKFVDDAGYQLVPRSHEESSCEERASSHVPLLFRHPSRLREHDLCFQRHARS